METETEFHDVFRDILLSLFEMVRVPEQVLTSQVGNDTNRTIAFCELLTHLAFLKTIPSPTFNSVYNLHMMG